MGRVPGTAIGGRWIHVRLITRRRLLALLVVVFAGLGVTYALVTPCFESPDEWSHLSLVRYFAAHRALPSRVLPPHRALTGSDVAWYLEYHDPPLYYAPPLYHSLAALLVPWADMDDLPYLLVPSPSWEAGWAPQPDGHPWNKNVYAHRAEETLAQSGTVRAAYLLRLISLGLGAVTILCTYALARLLWPGRPGLALGAAAFVALNPQFIAVSSGVTNDNLLNALFSLCLVCALCCMRDGASWSRWAMLGALVGLGLLTKQTALLLLPLGLLAIVWQLPAHSPRPRGRFRKVLADGSAFLAAARESPGPARRASPGWRISDFVVAPRSARRGPTYHPPGRTLHWFRPAAGRDVQSGNAGAFAGV